MGGEPKGNTSKNKQDLRGGFGLERCPNPACSQVFYENSQDYWHHAPRKMICAKCEREVVFQGTDFSTGSMYRTTYTYWCDFCKEEFRLTIPLTRKYCGVCKVEWYRSRSFHLRAPLPPHDPTNTCIPLDLSDDVAKESGDPSSKPSKAKVAL